jgi:hypothetical protein
MNELVELVARWRPELALAGARPADIDALAAAAPLPLPPQYADFLGTAGVHPREIFGPRHDLSVPALLRFHQRDDWNPPPPYLAIGVDIAGMDMDLYIDTETGAVVELMRWTEGKPPQVQYESLPRMLFSSAFYGVRMPLFPRRARFVQAGSSPTLDVLAALAAELQMPAVPHTGGWSPCYDSGEVALVAYEPPERGLYLEAGAADDARLAPLQHILERLLPVRRVG